MALKIYPSQREMLSKIGQEISLKLREGYSKEELETIISEIKKKRIEIEELETILNNASLNFKSLTAQEVFETINNHCL